MTTVQFLGTTYTPEILNALTTNEMLNTYNLVAANLGERRVVRFADRPTATKRTWSILARYAQEAVEEAALLELGQPAEVVALEEPALEEPALEEPALEEPAPKAERKERGFRFVFPLGDEIRPVRANSQRGKVLALLLRPGGATFEQVQEATGWPRKTAYEGIRLIHYYSGYGLSEEVRDGQTYIIARDK